MIEAGADVLRGHHIADRTLRGEFAVADQHGVRGGHRNLFQMVRHKDAGELRVVRAQIVEGGQQLLASGQVQSGRGFVE